MTRETLFTQEEIAARVEAMAKKIARAPLLPDIATPILVGGFIFAADQVRAL
jgi:hypoxanthine phosphoribosyltransferase